MKEEHDNVTNRITQRRSGNAKHPNVARQRTTKRPKKQTHELRHYILKQSISNKTKETTRAQNTTPQLHDHNNIKKTSKRKEDNALK